MSELLAAGLEKSYRKRKVVSSLSLSISSGEVVGLLGPNGAGKTTAFYMIVGFVPATAGESSSTARTSPRSRCTRARDAASATCRRNPRSSGATVVNNVKAILETRRDLDEQRVTRRSKACSRSCTSPTSATTLA